MENVESNSDGRQSQSAGSQLRAARESAGLSRSDIASKTKVAERHLLAIEDDRLGDLAARTYAVGFARAYARAVGLDEQVIAAKIREQLNEASAVSVATVPSFEPGDPARVPTRSIAWIAAGGVIVAIVILLVFWSSYLSPEGKLPDLTSDKPVVKATAPAVAAKPAPVAEPTTGAVVLTAAGDKVWLKITDATGAQVLQKELAKGESWTAPAGVAGLQLRTGRPDALQISVGGKALPPLSTEPKLVSGISLAAADLVAGAKSPLPATSQATQPNIQPIHNVNPSVVRTSQPSGSVLNAEPVSSSTMSD